MYEQPNWSNTLSYNVAAFTAYRVLPLVARFAPIAIVEKLFLWLDNYKTVVHYVYSRDGRIGYPIYRRRRFGLNGADQYDLIEDTALIVVKILDKRQYENKGGVYVQA
jgi:hypothetical protein